MSEKDGKTLKTRIQNKRGTTAEWATGTAPNFVPKDGEIVAYTDVHRIKIGDGTTKVSTLPFVDKVRDVTLGGETMVNANGVVELQQTVMTDGYVPVWNNTEGIFEDGINKSSIVTLGTEQRISGSKIFANNVVFEGQSEDDYLFDCYANDGNANSIMAVVLNAVDRINGKSKGELRLGDGGTECAISLKESYGTSGQVLTSQGSNKTPIWKTFTAPTPSNMVTTNTEQMITGAKTFISGSNYPQNIVDNGGMRIYSSPSVITSYSSTAIVRVDGSSPTMINLPSSGGTLALTNQIPIKTATLSGTTLSITLG